VTWRIFFFGRRSGSLFFGGGAVARLIYFDRMFMKFYNFEVLLQSYACIEHCSEFLKEIFKSF
jgi:hypothetical protein